MSTYAFSHLSDSHLLNKLTELVAQDWSTTAILLACIAEVDARKLYVPAAYPSMYAYCVYELRLSEDAAYKRIQAARAAREFPEIFDRLADGRLHLSAACLLSPYLTPANAHDLLSAATHKTKAEIEQLLAQQFPRTELLPMVEVLPGVSGRDAQLAPGQVVAPERERAAISAAQLAPGQVGPAVPSAKLTPIASQRFALQVSVGQETHDLLRHAQALLSHQIPAGDMAAVIHRALVSLVRELEKRKFAATSRPQRKRRPTRSDRHVPAHVKRAVLERDGGQCTFVSDAGKRCPSRSRLEFDHADPVARGGEATVVNLRLRCASHNQFTAECTFGAEFIENKREDAQRAAEARRAKAEQQARTVAEQEENDVTPWLRQLGFNAREASRAAAHCSGMLDASLEQRIRAALSFLRPRARALA